MINEYIHKEVTVEVKIVEAGITFVLTNMLLIYDSLRNPPDRLEAFDREGNAVFIMLPNNASKQQEVEK